MAARDPDLEQEWASRIFSSGRQDAGNNHVGAGIFHDQRWLWGGWKGWQWDGGSCRGITVMGPVCFLLASLAEKELAVVSEGVVRGGIYGDGCGRSAEEERCL